MVLLTSGAGRAQQPCDPPDARVVSIQGTVELRRAGTDVWTPAMLEEALCIGDALRVGQASRAALALANDSTLRLDQRTTLQLRGVAEEERSLLELLFGAVYFFSHRPRALEVDTPFVNAAAEGTEFQVRVGADRAEVVMLDGQVLLRNPQGELRVASGDAALIPEGEAPQPMIVARPRDAVAWALYYPPILTELAGRGARARPLPPGLQAAVERVADNDHASALDALEAVPEAARDARYHTYRAGVLLHVGRVDEAEAAIERALALDPEAGAALAQRAIIHVVQNREAEALADARRAVELSPESAAAAIALSYALQAAFQLEEARAALRQAVERNPEDALAWARLAELEQMFGELGASQDAAEQAVALAPGLSRTQLVLGFAALTRIDIDEAKAAFERAIALDSANPLPRLGLGLVKIRQSDLEQGRHEIEIAAGLDPNDALIRSYLGKAYFEERRDPLDARQFEIAKQLDPNDPTPWFYDAIRLQTENRPVEALRSIQRSIELNDNRAVYRSRLLLDEDLAARQTSLARIYDNLGFERLGLVEATKSLGNDPANYSAHRFLSDVYARLPRHEIARASELLQAQLLQPINIDPVQPSLPFSDLNVITAAGPATPSFNEFTPLFERNRAHLTASGVAGNDETLGDEVVASALWNRYSASAGQFHFETDGFRPNNGFDTNVYNAFGQVALTPKVNLQTEYRYRNFDQGDVELFFDPDDFLPDLERKVSQEIGRLGARVSPSSQLDLLASGFYTSRHERFPNDGEEVIDEGYQIEGQTIFRLDNFRPIEGLPPLPSLNLIAGLGSSDIDVELTFDDLFGQTTFNSKRQQFNAYGYGNIELPINALLTLGVSYDDYQEDPIDQTETSPKFGLQWDVTDDVRLRLATFRTVKRALSVSQTLEPTTIAGFNQFFDDVNGAKADNYGAGIDIHLTKTLYGGFEYVRRDLDDLFPVGDQVITEDVREEAYRSYLYWAPFDDWAFSLEHVFDRYKREENVFFFGPSFSGRPDNGPFLPVRLEAHWVPLSISYFAVSGLFATLTGTYVHQDMKTETGLDGNANPTKESTDSDFFLLDAAVGYRLPKRLGIASIEGLNLTDHKFDFRDDNFRSNEKTRPRIQPDRTVLVRMTLNF